METFYNFKQLNVYINKTPLFIDLISVFQKDFELTFISKHCLNCDLFD